MTEGTKAISILGSTGSVGRNTLEVVESSEGRFQVLGLSAWRNIELLADQIRRFRPRVAAVHSPDLANDLKRLVAGMDVEILYGKQGCKAVATIPEAQLVVSCMVGAAGLIPTLSAIEAGKDIALANKETLVTAGSLVTALAREKNVHILPVDSEHSAVFQCLSGQKNKYVERIILTASGGPFRLMGTSEMSEVTPEQATSHPNWSMGPKISVDSATLMNKGLEVIEAMWLFGIPVEKIHVVIHPQSIIHSMVEFIDGSILAQMGVPDMKIPISYALSWPERMDPGLPKLDLMSCGPLTFEDPDLERFPCLALAYKAAKTGGTAPTALNGANEEAVEAFMQRRIGFHQISQVVGCVLEDFPVEEIKDLDDVLKADALSRLRAQMCIERLT